jgi:hypothetical protein
MRPKSRLETDQNPYQSPLAESSKAGKNKLSGWTLFIVGAAALAPISWLLGRGLIPPDDVALRFSAMAWPVLVLVWGAILGVRHELAKKSLRGTSPFAPRP